MTDKKYDGTNRGQIWKNDRKEKDTHPDFTGSQNVMCPCCNNATNYWVSAWKRKEGAADRAPALSWSSKVKDGKPAPSAKTVKEDMDDEIPF